MRFRLSPEWKERGMEERGMEERGNGRKGGREWKYGGSVEEAGIEKR